MRLEILSAIHSGKSTFGEILFDGIDPRDLRSILKNMTEEKLLRCTEGTNGPYTLTDKGREYLLNLQQAENKVADERAQKDEEQRLNEEHRVADIKQQFRHDLVIALLSIAVTEIVHFLAGLF